MDRLNIEDGVPTMSLSIGKGKSRLGEDCGVDLLTTFLGTPSRGIIDTHGIIYFHSQSGYLMIKGVNDQHPVRYMLDNELKDLGAEQSHMLWQSTNVFYLGHVEFSLTYSRLDASALRSLRRALKKAFEQGGLSTPESRLPVLPNQTPLKRLGSAVAYVYVGSGGYGMVGVGVDISTGDPCAIKSVPIKKASTLREMINEIEISLKFGVRTESPDHWREEACRLMSLQDTAGLLQAWSVWCDHGKHFGPGEHDHVNAALTTCSLPDHIHIVMSLAKGSFDAIKWKEYDLDDLIDIFYGVLLGIAVLHEAGYMHRDLTFKNMLLMPGSPPFGVLSDFGKAIQKEWATDTHIGPEYSRAPEVNGTTKYSNKIDIFSCGQAFANILIERIFGSVFMRARCGQGQLPTAELVKSLNAVGKYGGRHRHIADIVKDMLSINTLNRPPIWTVLVRWEEIVSACAWNMGHGPDDARPVVDPIMSMPPPKLGSAHPVAPRPMRRQDRIQGQAAGSDLYADAFAGPTRGRDRETGKMIRAGGGGFTAVNKYASGLRPYLARPCKGQTPDKEPETTESGEVFPPVWGAVKRAWEDRSSEGPTPELKKPKVVEY